jgi:phosphatidylserine/phosphatidylglycerophosphate/cardiolipin synthase-like enzyme
MRVQDFEAILESTLADCRVSRGEAKALRAVLADVDPERLPALRSRVFAAARTAADERHPGQVIDWMEAMLKLLLPPPSQKTMAEAFFSPGEDCRNRIIGLLRGARERVDLCVFTITDNAVSREIYEAFRRGVKIRLITDNDKSYDRGSDVEDLDRSGIPIRIDQTDAHMHHKFAIFDGKTLLNGSYNWTRSAFTKNEENVLVTDDARFIKRFQGEFDRLWKRFG